MNAHDRTPAGYEAARTGSAVRARPRSGWLWLEGRDVVAFLHGILTNDIRAVGAGEGCYAAWLTPQGRMITDVRVLRVEDGAWLEVPRVLAAELAERIDGSIFTEDVRVTDRSASVELVEVHGPAAAAMAAECLGVSAKSVADLRPDSHIAVDIGGDRTRVIATGRLGLMGFDLAVAAGQAAAWEQQLVRAGAAPLSAEAAEALRIEAGTPVFGIDMTSETIPLEAGIEARAISHTKGCYVGQEIIVRILHRGHGRVARRLLGLRVDGENVPASGAPLVAAGRTVGHVTSAAWSPRLHAPLVLGYVHRDAGDGSVLHVGTDQGPAAEVVNLPIAG